VRYLSLFSGIEAATQAWHPLGWEPVAFAEIEGFPCAVLDHHYRDIPNLGDVSTITEAQLRDLGHIDLVVGGSPCQDLSVAGKRAGLAGVRSNLFHQQMRIFHAARRICGARWLLWENVPGAFSTHGGRDFAVVVSEMAGCAIPVPDQGWGTEGMALGEHGLVEWAVLDAQWFGVAQRRRRLFALLDAGNWQDRPPVLLEPEGMRGDSAPSREAGEAVAAAPGASAEGGAVTFGPGNEDISHAVSARDHKGPCSNLAQGTLIAFDTTQVTHPENRSNPRHGDPCHALPAAGHAPTIAVRTANTSANGHGVAEDVAHTLDQAQGQAIAFKPGSSAQARSIGAEVEVCPSLEAGGGGNNRPAIAFAEVADPIAANQANTWTREGENNFRMSNVAVEPMAVRRLTPVECERLQGFPDNFTRIPYRGKDADKCPDGPRYKALGNSMAVPVMAWIGRKIQGAC
jgi:DNA (cytosine-5)-methyltransferase 1